MAELPAGGSNYFSLHTHSQFSALDGMVKVGDLIDKAKREKHKGLAITDHGTMAGAVQLYQGAKAAGIKPFIGIEIYLIDPMVQDWETPARGVKVGRFHLGLMALNLEGYKALVKFSSLTHTRPRFNRFPRATLNDLAQLGVEHGDDLVLTTGCFFGVVQQALVTYGKAEAKKRIRMLSKWFPHLYIELQNHNIFHTEDGGTLPDYQEDDDIVRALYEISEELDLPVVATQDSHYCDQRQKKAHALMKKMVYGGAEDAFPGDSFHMASADWVAEHYDQDVWDKCEKGYKEILDLHDLTIPQLDTFSPDVPKIHKAPKKMLGKTVWNAWEDYKSEIRGRHQTYEDRIEYEMGVINHLGMAEYFLIVKDYVEWCKDEEIFIEARGSANGSLVCFLLGITQVDPIKWGVDFDRFLSKDRIKPPDIDMDIEDSERQKLVQYLLKKYKAVQIGTFGKLGMKYDEREDTEKGSVLQTWLTSKRRECEAIAAERVDKKGDIKAYAQAVFSRRYGEIKDIRDVQRIAPNDYAGLREIANMNSVFKSYGTHAGGILLSGQVTNIEDYIPTMLVASSNTRVSQFDMEDVEAWGLLKMDILGQATLRTMRLAMENAEKDNPIDFSWIPNDDKNAMAILRSGQTETGIFHQEGYTKAKGWREMAVKTTKDVILGQAIYMPGAMNTGQTAHVVRARKDPEFRQNQDYLHPIFEKHLKETYGAYVYQNQVMSILRDMGMDIPSINVFLKVVKSSGQGAVAKNAVKLAGLKETFAKLYKKHQMDPRHLDETWDALCGFGAYGFNKAHAAGYGIRSYRCAYLKAHYPAEFMAALLATWEGRDKETAYIRETRRLGLRMMPPDINVSGVSWSIDTTRNNVIRKGLASISGIGIKTAEALAENAPYDSVEEMVEKVPARALTGGKKYVETGEWSGMIGKLYESGALDNLLEGE